MKFTEMMLKNAKPKPKEYYLREDDGFVFRVRPTGSKAYYHIYDYKGKRQRLLIGNYDDVGLADAREIHSDQRKALRRGINPKISQAPPSPTPEEPSPPLTVATLAKEWLKEYSMPDPAKKKNNHSAKWHNTLKLALKKDIIDTAYGSMTAADLRRKDAIAIIGTKAAVTPGQSKNLLKALRQMYEYAVDRELLEFNPFANIKAKSIPALAPVHRDRVLSDDEIKHLLTALGTGGGSVATILALRLILLTAQRPGEVTGMRWDEIVFDKDGKSGWWTIPADKAKNNRENRVYLPPGVVDLINACGCADSEYVCLNIDPNAVAYHVRRTRAGVAKVAFYGLDRWTPHDLRRTAATGLSRLGCSDEIVDAILNHQKQGVIKIYNRNKYDGEKREWLTRWADHIFNVLLTE